MVTARVITAGARIMSLTEIVPLLLSDIMPSLCAAQFSSNPDSMDQRRRKSTT